MVHHATKCMLVCVNGLEMVLRSAGCAVAYCRYAKVEFSMSFCQRVDAGFRACGRQPDNTSQGICSAN